MGDRANIKFIDSQKGEIYFYTHWNGSNLSNVLKEALIRGESRWNDDQYLSRIIFSEMIKDDVLDTTGYGISTYLGDGADKVLIVDSNNQVVISYDGTKKTFKQFIE